MCLLEIAAPWNTVLYRVSRSISWRHWGETDTVRCGDRRSFPAGATLRSPGPPASVLLGQRTLHLKNSPQIWLRLRGPRPRAILTAPVPICLWGSTGGDALFLSIPIWGASTRQRPWTAPWAGERRGRNHWIAAACLLLPVHDGVNSITEKARRQQRGIQEEDSVAVLDIWQDQPEMPLRRPELP